MGVQEIQLLRRISFDRNIVQFYGACLESQPPMLVMEYMAVRRAFQCRVRVSGLRVCTAPASGPSRQCWSWEYMAVRTAFQVCVRVLESELHGAFLRSPPHMLVMDFMATSSAYSGYACWDHYKQL